ncbi:MAG: hypothetical protein IKB32_01155 [Clostridia bacterium]|nr:hypothetical protein [Clostridia bacterium]
MKRFVKWVVGSVLTVIGLAIATDAVVDGEIRDCEEIDHYTDCFYDDDYDEF